MDKDLKLHIEFDIQQLESLWSRLALYPELQQKVRDFINVLEDELIK